ncbi:DUF6928 family protein [Williamsia maris]|uniref:DUF4240 domain-containing protein n=1 Tax=Williamsia maris TaxID=72806 RepID=A0ABT1HAV1_9NOCA|nr:hypothetical protein [Williamsia maris]MCP2174875.1 hypothetical protein [Williamsia maris]
MAATASMLWLIDSDDFIADLRLGLVNDRESATAMAHRLFADNVLLPIGDTTLDRAASCADDEVFVGVFGRFAVIAGATLDTTAPSQLPDVVLAAHPAETAYLIHTDPEASVGVFAQWDNGTLRRSFSADPVDIAENLGLPFPFERSFWAGEHPLVYAEGVPRDPQALPFHPIEFADHAAREWLGMRLTRPWDDGDIVPDRIPLSGFAIRPPGYQPTDDELAGRRAPSSTDTSTPESSPPAPADEPPTPTARVARWFGFGKRD